MNGQTCGWRAGQGHQWSHQPARLGRRQADERGSDRPTRPRRHGRLARDHEHDAPGRLRGTRLRPGSPRSPGRPTAARRAARPRAGTAPGAAWCCDTSSPQTVASKFARPDRVEHQLGQPARGGGHECRRQPGRPQQPQGVPRTGSPRHPGREQLGGPPQQPVLGRVHRETALRSRPTSANIMSRVVAMSVPTIASRVAGDEHAAEVHREIGQRDVPEPLGVDEGAVHVPEHGCRQGRRVAPGSGSAIRPGSGRDQARIRH